MSFLRPDTFPAALLSAALALATLPATAHAGFEKLQGQYNGVFASSATSDLSTTRANGPARSTVRSLANGKRGRVNLFGSHNGTPYHTKIEFKANGVCTTDSLLPGVNTYVATGSWTANPRGTKVKFNFSIRSPIDSYYASGVITGTGEHLKIRIAYSAKFVLPGQPHKGAYLFTGSR